MSTFNPGTGSELKSTNLPAALIEILSIIKLQELTLSVASRFTNFRFDIPNNTTEHGTFTASGSYDYTESLSAEGSSIDAIDYLSGYSFTAGSGGDIAGSNLIDVLHQTLLLTIAAQQAAGVPVVTSFSNSGVGSTKSYSVQISFTFGPDASGNFVPVAVDNL